MSTNRKRSDTRAPSRRRSRYRGPRGSLTIRYGSREDLITNWDVVVGNLESVRRSRRRKPCAYSFASCRRAGEVGLLPASVDSAAYLTCVLARSRFQFVLEEFARPLLSTSSLSRKRSGVRIPSGLQAASSGGNSRDPHPNGNSPRAPPLFACDPAGPPARLFFH